MNELLKVEHLKKSYGEKNVIKDLSFSIRNGEILCLLGPNGAGKSTTMNILCRLLDSDQGKILWRGKDVNMDIREYKAGLGVVPQELALYENLTAEKNVTFFASLYGLKGDQLKSNVTEALEFVGLLQHRKEIVSTFSGGMKRRLNIACSIAHHPQLLIMDEPTVGIDPQSRNHILESIKKMRRKGMTILYTSHYMEEVEEISDRILIMDVGSIIAEGTKESLKEENFPEREFVLEIEESKEKSKEGCQELCQDAFYRVDGVKNVECQENTIIISSLKTVENLDQIIAEAQKQRLKIVNLFCRQETLENVFLKLTGKNLRD